MPEWLPCVLRRSAEMLFNLIPSNRASCLAHMSRSLCQAWQTLGVDLRTSVTRRSASHVLSHLLQLCDMVSLQTVAWTGKDDGFEGDVSAPKSLWQLLPALLAVKAGSCDVLCHPAGYDTWILLCTAAVLQSPKMPACS